MAMTFATDIAADGNNTRNIGTASNKFKINGVVTGNSIWYGECSTAAATQAKAVTITGVTEYHTGDVFVIAFTKGQTYNGAPTLNVNSLGAKTIQYLNGTNGIRYMWVDKEVVTFVYNGTYFVAVENGLATTTYYGVVKLSSATNSTSAAYAATPAAVKATEILEVSVTATSEVSTTIENTAITANHVVLNDFMSWASDITWSTDAGTMTISSSNGIPAMTLYLALKQ